MASKPQKRQRSVADLYSELTKMGVLTPSEVPTDFAFPTVLVETPAVTTYGVYDQMETSEKDSNAGLGPGS